MKKIILAFGMVLATAFACFAASPAKDFGYELMSESELTDLSQYVSGLNTKGDFIEIYEYNGRDSTVEIPAEIEGCKVIKVRGVSADKIVVPASVVWFVGEGDREREGTEFEFKRPKTAAFFWEISSLEYVKNLELDRKIIFAGERLELPSVESFTWSKNWSTMVKGYFGSKPKYNSLEFRLAGFTLKLVIEDGITELPFTVYNCCQTLVLPKTLKTIRAITDRGSTQSSIISEWDSYYESNLRHYENSAVYNADGTKEYTKPKPIANELVNIVIPAGAKIKIEPGAIRGVDHMSITTQKALKAQGYSW